MASTAGYIISSSCHHVMDDQHWLARAYPPFAVPYFVYDVYAMFLCHRHRGRVKGHEAGPPPPLRAAAAAYLRKDLLMVLHHAAMVLVCFPVLWRQDKGDFFLGCLLMAELSTPFVCLGKVLILVTSTRPPPPSSRPSSTGSGCCAAAPGACCARGTPRDTRRHPETPGEPW
uniref:TLC domain containing 3B n=1 Tax=Nothoprocta perdicaria TaxID=30464 RepID=A0A8C7EF99_NOTPE